MTTYQPELKRNILDELPQMDPKKATKLLLKGLIVAIVFGMILLTSRSIASYSSTYKNIADLQNNLNVANGLYGYADYLVQQQQIQLTVYIMSYQVAIVGNLARVGINIGLVLMVLGFLALAFNTTMDDKSRKIMLVFACLLLFVIIFTTAFSGISISVTV
nr:hypothetical protein [Candidatus Sigynarchaeota archaeon]